jgi:hypothetical protein
MYRDPDRIYELLRAAHAPLEDHQMVEMCLRERRPGGVDLRLTEAQYQKLTATK